MSRLGFPVRFTGTPEEAWRNMISHHWASLDGEDWRCDSCDCHYGGAVSTWPCGVEPERRTYEKEAKR